MLKRRLESTKEIPAHKSLFSTPKNKGLPIGNLTSQFFANVYLNQLDQYVKRKLKVKHYFRYADDMIVLDSDTGKIKSCQREIDSFLQEKLKLKLHPGKNKFGSVCSGIDFVGCIIKPEYSLIRKRTIKNLKTKLYFFNQGFLLLSNNQIEEAVPLCEPPSRTQLDKILSTVNSYYGLMAQADCYRLRKSLYQKNFKSLKLYLEPIEDYKYFKLRNNV